MPECTTCHVSLVQHAPTTPEQEWCGTWLEHPPLPGFTSSYGLTGHTTSVLLPSEALRQSLAVQAATNPTKEG